MSFALPVARVRETPTLIAFHHPRPSYAVHIVLVPKRAIASLAALTPADADFPGDLFAAVQNLVAELRLEQTGYRLIANGGAYQEVAQLHFHLVADQA
jgi:histidine triad (HIT) family protein